MNYIVFDLEFNQSFDFKTGSHVKSNPECPFEIIQIGAVKMNQDFQNIGEFNFYIRPVIYRRLHPYVEKITGITQEIMENGIPFEQAYNDFLTFVSKDDILCSWGNDDIKSLFRNVRYHKLSSSKIPDRYMNIQSFATSYLNYEPGKAIGLKNAVDMLGVNIESDFHNALNDATYTAEVFKIVCPEILVTEKFKPSDIKRVKELCSKKRINTKSLFKYFSQSLDRELSPEERAIIKTAYKFGRNNTYDL
ncbi:DNA polymerase III PolC-type [bioreactor metagenome]|uniref:DNA polymerase III PolC-type n=1 Tax=bioreactor metagenome TaxID=1076179 RepID=A0A644ZNE2_9ZZZZ|nr:3'-5' exonuclease [Candidatus Metalachnospira sp.]